jgi:DNA primase
LNSRGIPDEVIETHLLGWNGWRITIPVTDRGGRVALFRLAKDPQDKRPAPKMLSSPGSKVELYGWEQVLRKPSQLIICEGEFDRLVLEAQGFAAVTSTGGAATFRPEWAKEISMIENVYVCFDRDNAGRNGATVVGLMIPHARLVELPAEVGEGGDITDFFVALKRSHKDFLTLLNQAQPIRSFQKPLPRQYVSRVPHSSSPARERIERIKNDNPIEKVVGEYVKLQGSGKNLMGLCPFHKERTASLSVYPQSGTYYCFGCRRHGDVIRFIQDIEHMTFPQALDALDTFRYQNEQESTLQ